MSAYVTPHYVKAFEKQVMEAYPIKEKWLIPFYVKSTIRVALNNGMTIKEIRQIVKEVDNERVP